MGDLKSAPFFLKDEDIAWVNQTIDKMTLEEKVAQLFCLISYASDPDYLLHLAKEVKPGGLMCRPMPKAEVVETIRTLQAHSAIPMLIAANLEKGGNGIADEGTFLGSPLEIAATNNDEMGALLGEVCGSEGASLGCNWAFAPIIDIDHNFRNPITNTRTFGSDPQRVMRMGVGYVKAVQKHGVAASIKHFPGDGMDERDQHLVTSINSLSTEQWDQTYGMIYQACIDAGAMTCMIGHIMQPAYSKALNPKLTDADILPASLSYELVTQLLKEKLGFNGLVVTDATTMAGMVIPMPREKAVPQAIAAGCDMFLFARNLEEDMAYMKKGVEDGTITQERMHDALTKILGLKAALGLHQQQADGTLPPTLDRALPQGMLAKHQGWAKDCADQAITLVKEEQGVLPLTPARYPKVLFYAIESEQGFAYSVRKDVAQKFKERLDAEGFDIDVFDPAKGMEGLMTPFSAITDKYDLIVYLANMSTKSNQTIVRIEWAQPMGANVPVYMTSVPTVFISVENPYHLVDVPRVRTFINAYASTDTVLDALVDKLTGRASFKGINPVDPFCGMWDTRL